VPQRRVAGLTGSAQHVLAELHRRPHVSLGTRSRSREKRLGSKTIATQLRGLPHIAPEHEAVATRCAASNSPLAQTGRRVSARRWKHLCSNPAIKQSKRMLRLPWHQRPASDGSPERVGYLTSRVSLGRRSPEPDFRIQPFLPPPEIRFATARPRKRLTPASLRSQMLNLIAPNSPPYHRHAHLMYGRHNSETLANSRNRSPKRPARIRGSHILERPLRVQPSCVRADAVDRICIPARPSINGPYAMCKQLVTTDAVVAKYQPFATWPSY